MDEIPKYIQDIIFNLTLLLRWRDKYKDQILSYDKIIKLKDNFFEVLPMPDVLVLYLSPKTDKYPVITFIKSKNHSYPPRFISKEEWFNDKCLFYKTCKDFYESTKNFPI